MEAMRQSWTDDRLDEFRQRVDERFDAVDQRFDAVDQRLDRIDQRFEQVDERFDLLEKGLEHRFDRMEADIRELRLGFAGMQRGMLQLGGGIFVAMLGLIVTQL